MLHGLRHVNDIHIPTAVPGGQTCGDHDIHQSCARFHYGTRGPHVSGRWGITTSYVLCFNNSLLRAREIISKMNKVGKDRRPLWLTRDANSPSPLWSECSIQWRSSPMGGNTPYIMTMWKPTLKLLNLVWHLGLGFYFFRGHETTYGRFLRDRTYSQHVKFTEICMDKSGILIHSSHVLNDLQVQLPSLGFR